MNHPAFSVALPMTAVPATMPSASKATSARLPFGSVMSARLQHPVVILASDVIAHRVVRLDTTVCGRHRSRSLGVELIGMERIA